MNKYPKEVLNEIKWRYNKLSETRIYYLSRGSPNNESVKEGKDILWMDGFCICFYGVPYNSYIPYHRILKIMLEKQILFERRKN